MLSEDFNNTIDTWIENVTQYSFEQLCSKPAPNSWSLGQLCVHLADATHFFLEQAVICSATNENAKEEMSANAKEMFAHKAFPDKMIEGPASNKDTRQPSSKAEILNAFAAIKERISDCDAQISTSIYKGKTRHPGLLYFNAIEWLLYAYMHWRHHARQQNRIKAFLKLA
jgi:hypothetical protein